MTPTPRLRRHAGLVAVPTLTTIGGLAAVAMLSSRGPTAAAPLLVNESPSLPKGVYLRIPSAAPEPGAVVALRQPAGVRPYLAGLGLPGEVRLLKRVAAGAGARVCAGGGHVRIGGRALPVLAYDRRGAALPAWRGCRQLRAGELFLLGDTAASFDSRYFGPVRRAEVEGVYRELVTW